MKIFDTHIHTHFGYCADSNMYPKDTIKIASKGNHGICLVEHAGQLYCKRKDFWNVNFLEKPNLIYKKKHNRMDDFIEYLNQYRSEDVLIGIEVDLNKNGQITLHENHMDSWDVILGAMHFPLKQFKGDIHAWFMWSLEKFSESPIDVLVHPFRYYFQKKLGRPTYLYEPTIEMLKSHNIAAEINFHISNPDPVFFEMCINRGVKIALGSDSHCLEDVCKLEQHMDFLKKISHGKKLEEILYKYT